MRFVRFACFLLVALPVTSLSVIKFHQDKDAAKELDVATVEKEFLTAVLDNNVGGRKLAVKNLMLLDSIKHMGVARKKIPKVLSSSNQIVRKCHKEEQISSAESRAVYNADYLTHMHHPPKHN